LDDENERDELRKLVAQYDRLDSTWGQPSSMSYCYLYFNLIVACAIRGNMSHCSIHDGCGVLRGGDPHKKSAESLLAVAALRRAMELWTDSLVLASCGDAIAPAARELQLKRIRAAGLFSVGSTRLYLVWQLINWLLLACPSYLRQLVVRSIQ